MNKNVVQRWNRINEGITYYETSEKPVNFPNKEYSGAIQPRSRLFDIKPAKSQVNFEDVARKFEIDQRIDEVTDSIPYIKNLQNLSKSCKISKSRNFFFYSYFWKLR